MKKNVKAIEAERLAEMVRTIGDTGGPLLRTYVNLHVDEGVRQATAGRRAIPFVCSTEGTKRDGNSILTAGWELENYLRSGAPVQWCHDTRSPSIANAPTMRSEPRNKRLICEAVFPLLGAYDFADLIYRLYSASPPVMRAGSVQWFPLEVEPNVNEQGRQVGWIFKRQELLEFSLCPVPADPDAVTRAIQQHLILPEEADRLVWKVNEKTSPIVVRVEADEPIVFSPLAQILGGEKKGGSDGDTQEEQQERGKVENPLPPDDGDPDGSSAYVPEAQEARAAVTYSSHGNLVKVDESQPWDGRTAEISVRRWASSDGSGARDKMDWNKYRQVFAWYDAGNKESFASYKLPHHVADGELKHHWRGGATAMAALLGSRGGVQIPTADRRAVYNHLVAEYGRFDKEPPEFRTFGDLEDLAQALETDEWQCSDSGTLILLVRELEAESERQTATRVQTVILAKSRFKSATEARKWIKDHGFKDTGVDETENSYRFRQFDPGRCQEGSFRTIQLDTGVSAVICRPKERARGELADAITADEELQLYNAFDQVRVAYSKVMEIVYYMEPGEMENEQRIQNLLSEFAIMVAPFLLVIANSKAKAEDHERTLDAWLERSPGKAEGARLTEQVSSGADGGAGQAQDLAESIEASFRTIHESLKSARQEEKNEESLPEVGEDYYRDFFERAGRSFDRIKHTLTDNRQ